VSLGTVVWLTGLPSSGKSSLAERTRARLLQEGWYCVLLDGDAVRAALVPEPGYLPPARADFYETLARLAALLAKQGLIVLVAATAHRRAFRDRARELAPRFMEVFVDTDITDCVARDTRGLYASARAGLTPEVPGVGVLYEAPRAPDVVASGGFDDAAVERLAQLIVGEPRHRSNDGPPAESERQGGS
jgi:adenylylsulfate kinase